MNFLPRQRSLLTSLVFSITFILSANTQAKEFAETGVILTSIKPLQLIAADITQGVIKVESLLPAGASPHSYSLRPSEVKRIHSAKRIFWVGPAMESFLLKPFSKYPDKTHSFTKLIISDAFLLNSTESSHNEIEDEHQHETQAEHEQHSGHESNADEHIDQHDHQHEPKIHQHKYLGKDPHIWLSPNKALQMAAQIRDEVSVLYPQHEQRIADNFQQFSEQMNKVDLKLRSEFSPLKALGFLVFHDAYSRFVEHYQLNQIAALTINPAKRPGAKHLAQIREMIKTTQPVCIFSEPQFAGVAIKTVVRGFDIEIGELDPLGVKSNSQQNRYAHFISQFAQQFIDCLGAQR